MPGPLEADLDEVGLLPAVGLAPAVGEQAAQPSVGRLPQLVATGHLDVQALVPDLEIVSQLDSSWDRGKAPQA